MKKEPIRLEYFLRDFSVSLNQVNKTKTRKQVTHAILPFCFVPFFFLSLPYSIFYFFQCRSKAHDDQMSVEPTHVVIDRWLYAAVLVNSWMRISRQQIKTFLVLFVVQTVNFEDRLASVLLTYVNRLISKTSFDRRSRIFLLIHGE